MADKQLIDFLALQLADMQSLTALMDEELKVIAKRDGDALKACSQEKAKLIRDISQRDNALKRFDLKQLRTEDREIHDSISAIETILAECQEKNEVNAKAALQAQLSVQKVKDILIGLKPASTYSSSGTASSEGSRLGPNLKA